MLLNPVINALKVFTVLQRNASVIKYIENISEKKSFIYIQFENYAFLLKISSKLSPLYEVPQKSDN